MTAPQDTCGEHVLRLADETLAAGRALGELLVPGDVVALQGQLGAGKTQFVKGLALGLSVPADEPVVSPTFVLVREYFGRLKLYHLDAYRLGSSAELEALGWEEMRADEAAVVALEWADRVADALPASACRIELAHVAPNVRSLRVTWPDQRCATLRRVLSARLEHRGSPASTLPGQPAPQAPPI